MTETTEIDPAKPLNDAQTSGALLSVTHELPATIWLGPPENKDDEGQVNWSMNNCWEGQTKYLRGDIADKLIDLLSEVVMAPPEGWSLKDAAGLNARIIKAIMEAKAA